MIYFWSDTHFNHEGVIRYCNRPYQSVAEMNVALVAAWNRAVTPKDTIYHVGDWAFMSKDAGDFGELYGALNGHKHLVRGNHDEKNPKALKLPWESISDLVTVRDQGMRAIACHYPMETWKGSHKGYLMIHGHSHGSLKRVLPHRFDVGCDVWPEPVSFSHLWQLASTQIFEAQDHHEER